MTKTATRQRNTRAIMALTLSQEEDLKRSDQRERECGEGLCIMTPSTVAGNHPTLDLPAEATCMLCPRLELAQRRSKALRDTFHELAAAHAVETGVLVNYELLPRIPCTKGVRAGQTLTKFRRYSFFFDAHTLNGVGDRARLWVSLLEELTCIQRIDL